MLTPAEEMGLSGLRLASRVRKAFQSISEPALIELMQRIRDQSYRRHLIYLRDGQPDVIRVLPCPITVLPEQLAYIHYVSQTILSALKRLAELYLQDATVHELLRLPPAEDKWLRGCWAPGLSDSNPVFGRLDAMIDFISPMWKDSLRFVEPNLTGIGGLHLIPTAERILSDVVAPVLRSRDPRLQLELGPDIRDLLMQEVLDHGQALNRRPENVCFVEPKYAGSGPDEQGALAEFYHERYGMRLLHADPTELHLAAGEIYYDDARIDLAYRDYAVGDLLKLEHEGADVQPMRELFTQNRMISSIAAELDQKSCWEVLTDPALTQKYFNSDERQIFRRHILWTRLLGERRTILPDGVEGDLLDYVRRGRETLVLKPNRAYGGEGVWIGHTLTQGAWDSVVNKAVADEERWVVQQLASIPVSEFAVLGSDGHLHSEPFYTVMGFAPSRYGLAILGRASQKQVVNVAQRGGMCAVMIGHAQTAPANLDPGPMI
jgi:hypothetical protein